MSKVYAGGVPTGGFTPAYNTSNEGESSMTPGGPAARPGVVREGGVTQPKNHSKSASESFLMDSSYKTSLEVGRPNSSKTVNPDDVSHTC